MPIKQNIPKPFRLHGYLTTSPALNYLSCESILNVGGFVEVITIV